MVGHSVDKFWLNFLYATNNDLQTSNWAIVVLQLLCSIVISLLSLNVVNTSSRLVFYASQVYITGKSKVRSKHKWHPDGQSTDVIADEYDNSTKRLSSCATSDTYTNTLHTDNVSSGSTSYSTQNRTFWRRYFQPGWVPGFWSRQNTSCIWVAQFQLTSLVTKILSNKLGWHLL